MTPHKQSVLLAATTIPIYPGHFLVRGCSSLRGEFIDVITSSCLIPLYSCSPNIYSLSHSFVVTIYFIS